MFIGCITNNMTTLEHKVKTVQFITWISKRFELQPTASGEYLWKDCKGDRKLYNSDEVFVLYNRTMKKQKQDKKLRQNIISKTIKKQVEGMIQR